MKQSHGHFALRTSARLLLSAMAVASFSTSIHAEETLDTMTVTANRMPSANTLAPTTIITRADIERLQINDLPTLLSRQPGIDMSVSGGVGKTSSLSIRGTNSDHVLFLVDGVKWHSATAGGASIQNFPVEQIERIEIVRGSRSGLYGSEAMGGVIQIFTRKGGNGVTPYAKIAYGTHNTKQAAAGVSGGDADTHYSINVNHQSTDGINARQYDNPDKDGYRNNSISATLQHEVSNTLSVGVNMLRSEGFNEYDGFNLTSTNKGQSVQQILGANAQLHINDSWLASLALGESRDESLTITNGLNGDTFNTRHRFASLTNTITLSPNHTVNIGLDYSDDYVGASTPNGTAFDKVSRNNKAEFISWQGQYNKHSWLISARHDDNEAFGRYNTGTAEWGYRLRDDLQFTANLGTAFKTPTFNDLYYPTTAFFVGNPTLKPEKSKSYGIGLTAEPSWGHWSIQAYKTDVRDLLLYVFPKMENVNKANIKGVEFDIATTLVGWDIALNASLLKPEDKQTGNILPRRAKRLANVNIDKQWGAWSSGASWKLRGHSFDNAANTTRLGGFGLLDIRLAYDLTADWSLKANVSNLFDKQYQTVNNYNSLDRTIMFTLSYLP